MAKFLYDSGKTMFLANTHAWTTSVRGLLVDSTYVASSTVDNNLDDITAGKRIGTAVAITNPTTTAGVADCDPITFTAVASGDTVAGIVFYWHTGTESTSTLIAYDGEDSGGTTFAVPTNDGDIVYTPNASGVFSL